MPGLYGYTSNANVSVSNTTGLYIGSGNVSILNSAQQLLSLLDNNGNVNFALDPATSYTTVLAYSVVPVGTYSNVNVAAYLPTYTGNLSPSYLLTNNILYANGQPYSFGSSYGNTQVAAYLAGNTDPTISNLNANASIQAVQILNINTNVATLTANLGAFETYANATFGTSNYSNVNVAAYIPTDPTIIGIKSNIQTLSANLGAFETYANATFGTSSYGNANVAAYLASNTDPTISYINANLATTTVSLNVLTANVGAFETYANAQISTINANLGAFETYANAQISTITANLGAFET